MKRSEWSASTSTEEAHRRASGRRQYNSIRQARAIVRRFEAAELLDRLGYAHGVQVVIARRLGHHGIGVEIDQRYCQVAANRLQHGLMPAGGTRRRASRA